MGPDFHIIQEVLRGNRARYAELVRRYQHQIYSLGWRLFRNREEAEDFTQEVFLKAYQQLGTFRGESQFNTWLFRIGYFLGLSWNRRTKPTVPLPEDFDTPGTSDNPEHLYAQQRALQALREAIEELPDRYRISLELYFSLGMTFQDIAEITDIPVGTIKSHVFRAKHRLKQALTGTEAEGTHEL